MCIFFLSEWHYYLASYIVRSLKVIVFHFLTFTLVYIYIYIHIYIYIFFFPFEKTLMLRNTEDKRRRKQQRMRGLDRITDTMDRNLSKLQDIVKNRGAWCAAVHGVSKNQT